MKRLRPIQSDLRNRIIRMYDAGSKLDYKETAKILLDEGYDATTEMVQDWIETYKEITWQKFQKYITEPDENGCRFWTGPKSGPHTGCFNQNDHTTYAHRYYFETINNRKLEPHERLTRTCGNKLCVVHFEIKANINRTKYKYKQCSIDGCNRTAKATGMCVMHYTRQYVHGNPHTKMKTGRERVNFLCSHTDCDRKARALGLCKKHYDRHRKYGDIFIKKPRGRPKKVNENND